jgi:Xaa-Pro aminopeptidase
MAPSSTSSAPAGRVARARERMRLAGLDAFVVTHLSNIAYLTGLQATAGLVVLSADSCVLAVDFRYQAAAGQARAAAPETLEVAVVEGSFDEWLAAHLGGRGLTRIGVEAETLSVGRFNRLSSALAAAAPTPFGGPDPCPSLVPHDRFVEALRVVKDAGELATLREAGRRISRVARRLPSLVRAGMRERDAAAEIDAAMRGEGFDRPAFETIVASGPNSALPHARPGGRVLQAGEGVVLDFGGVYDGYCVDLTRTLRLGAQPAALDRLFAAVRDAHAAAIGTVRPGALPSQIDGAARTVLDAHGLGAAFGHGTGHGLGLEVHEEPRIGRLLPGRTEQPVAAGMVFTIEPGAYVEGLGGVRIEDDVVVVDGGYELLTDVPVDLSG